MNVLSPQPHPKHTFLGDGASSEKKFPNAPDLMWNKLVFLSSKLSGFLEKSC